MPTTSGSGRRTSSGNSSKRTQSSSARSNTRRNSSSKSSSGKKNASSELDFSIKSEIILILIFAVVIFLFLCTVGIIGAKEGAKDNLGDYVQSMMLGLFGLGAYVVPLISFFAIAFGISNKNNSAAILKIVAIVLVMLSLGCFAQMICIKDLEMYVGSKEWFKEFYALKTGGGAFFGSIALLLYSFLGKAGTIFCLIVILLICIVILTGKSLLRGVKEGSKKIYETTKEDGLRLKEMNENRRNEYMEQKSIRQQQEEAAQMEEDEKILRMNKKVNGVTIHTSLVQNEGENSSNSQNQVEETYRKEVHTEPSKQIVMKDEKNIEIKLPEKNDIHMVTFDENDDLIEPEEDWIKPVEKDAFSFHEEIIAHPDSGSYIQAPEVQIEALDTPILSVKPQMEPVPITQAVIKPVAHLRSADKADMKPISNLSSKPVSSKKYQFPPISLLKKGDSTNSGNDSSQLKETARRLEQTLETFGVKVRVTDFSQGPAVTRYELHPEQGVKVSKIVSLADDIKLNLAASDIRIEAPIPGKMAVGIEVPNKSSCAVAFRELVDNKDFKTFPSNLAFAVGKDIGGQIVLADIAKMPHLLIAGATGSGKSVCINTLIMSIIYKSHPDDVKMIMIDPKVVELNVYNGIPHLLIPVVTDPKKASAALQWGVSEMTERYKKFADSGVRDLKGYNQKAEAEKNNPSAEMKKMPQIIIIVDELADLMMVASKEVEESICRLAQLARAAGIHLIIATQRPSVDVITGLIKANMPSRIAFSVSSGIDSRTILDANGAEKLLGKGDMLFFPQGFSKPSRVQGAFISDKEVVDVVEFIKNQAIGNDYSDRVEEVLSGATSAQGGSMGNNNELDAFFADAGKFVIEKEKGSIGMLQRVFKIGFNRAARIMDQLEEAGVVGAEEGTKPRRIIMTMDQFEDYLSGL